MNEQDREKPEIEESEEEGRRPSAPPASRPGAPFKDKGASPEGRPPGRGKRKGGPPRGFQWRRASKVLFLWIFFFLVVIFAAKFFGSSIPSDTASISFKTYRELLHNRKIKSADIVETNFQGHLFQPEALQDETGNVKEYQHFVVNLGIIDSQTRKEWEEYGVDFKFKSKPYNWLNFLFNMLPWVLFMGLWIFVLRQMQGGPKGAFSFGKSRAKLVSEDKPKVTFKDVAGVEEAKQELQEIIEILKDPRRFQKLGGRIPKGVLLVGPPGTGKTYIAKAVAGEAGVPFFSMSGSDFVEMFVGVGASRVRDLFEQGKAHAPCIIFIDEIDAVGRHRGAGIGGGHDEREQTLNQLLVEMDGFESNEGVILIAATNRPDVLDPALLRPGRFDRQVVVDRPDVKGREGVLAIHTRNIPLAKGVNLKTLARATPGLSQADLANLVNEAALMGSRFNRDRVTMMDFEAAKDKVMMGAERRSLIIPEEERRLVAYHEIGHALVSKLVPGSDPVHKATIIPIGRALGVTHFLPKDERHVHPKSYWFNRITMILGGRVAEKIVFGETANGAADDYERATAIARNMVCEWGMSDRLGPMTYGKKEEEIFLGREISQHRDYSERTAQTIDEEINSIVMSAEKRAEDLLRANEDKLHLLVNTLLEFEVLDGSQIDRILAGEVLRRPHHQRPRGNGQHGNGRTGPGTRGKGPGARDEEQEAGETQAESPAQDPEKTPPPAE
ncbi:MAG: ATP-dependent metallopeptidase FtsH/Yme1/Tma family protein [Candidatus Latescibacteria bacterium]|nr:ATP-dependent metallopeptidase FtsH/Yme1/Tma family protein [Candidatus Latescibacterota bacterium]